MRIKKSFTFRFSSSNRKLTPGDEITPARGVAKDLFRPAADRYRQRLSKFALSAIAGFLLAAVSLLVPEFLLKWVAIPGICLIGFSLVLFFSLPELRCPSCGKLSDNGFERFCPACGKEQLRISRLWGTHCDACGRNMGSYKYRNYPIRYCTDCGVLLHGPGV
jgi:hypothetical protein